MSDGDLETKQISPSFLVRNWPPAFKEWSTKSVRDAFFASPQFPRLINAELIKDTISRGVGSGLFAYVGKTHSGEYNPFTYNRPLMISDIELSEDMFIVGKETADAFLKTKTPSGNVVVEPKPEEQPPSKDPEVTIPGGVVENPPLQTTDAKKLTWTGELLPQKWMNFYTKVLAKFASSGGLKISVTIEVEPTTGLSKQKIDETRTALRELGLGDDVKAK
jgi:hypothetical protein